MKKGLIIWNIIVTVVALALILSACTSDSRVTVLQGQVAQLQAIVQTQQNDINSLKSVDNQLTTVLQQQVDGLRSEIYGVLQQAGVIKTQ